MDNLKLPAYPCPQNVIPTDYHGFSKLELASLMIAQGMISNNQDWKDKWEGRIAESSVELAKAVLDEANK
jgi:hypothetical protein